LVAAGLAVERAPSAEEILNASCDTPVLFEVKRDGSAVWLLAHVRDNQPHLSLLRNHQIVTRFDQCDLFPVLAGIIASGAGTITFAGTDLRLVLFVCGENNLLQCSGKGRSVLKRPPEEDRAATQRLAAVLSGPWVVLNPAHNPYYPQIRSTGFAKVGVVQSKKPTLRRLVEASARFRDGTETPVAVVHVNNFDPGQPKTAEYTEVAFGDYEGRVRRVPRPRIGSATGREETARSSLFEVQVGRHRA
jgi:hypothetical protein